MLGGPQAEGRETPVDLLGEVGYRSIDIVAAHGADYREGALAFINAMFDFAVNAAINDAFAQATTVEAAIPLMSGTNGSELVSSSRSTAPWPQVADHSELPSSNSVSWSATLRSASASSRCLTSPRWLESCPAARFTRGHARSITTRPSSVSE